MKGLLVLNGERDIHLPCGREYDYIVVCDGAYENAKKETSVSYVIGDFDSLNYIPEGVPTIKLDKEKDYTDGEVAMRFLLEKGCNYIDICWALGGRIDHMLGNFSLLKIGIDNNITAKVISKDCEIHLINKEINLQGVINKTISLLPFSDKVVIDSAKGLKYCATGLTLTKEQTIGLSNIAISRNVSIRVSLGELLVIVNNM